MKVNNQWIRGIWSDDGGKTVCFPDQTKLPFRLEICREGTSDALIRAIKSMQVRGAPLIGARYLLICNLHITIIDDSAARRRLRKSFRRG